MVGAKAQLDELLAHRPAGFELTAAKNEVAELRERKNALTCANRS